jgi:hypothetical protein
MDDEILNRFMNYIKKTDDCWEWTGGKCEGYGAFSIQHKSYIAHRVMWIHCFGTIDDGLVVRHKCKGKCVNPDHLELGPPAANTADRIRDGTDAKGERNPKAKLAPEKILQIRARASESRIVVAREFGVSPETINDIVRRRSWKHIT